jgi:membrane protease YdiL (CAAX protease family)
VNDAPLPAQEVPPPRSPARLLAELALAYLAFAGLLAALGSDAFLRLTARLPTAAQLVLHVGTTLAVGLGGVWLLVRKEPSPRASLGLEPLPVRQALGYGGAGFLLSYAGSTTLGVFYLLASRTSPADLMTHRGPVLELFAATPLWMVLPLALAVGFYEEVLFRGYLLGRLRRVLLGSALSPLRRDALAVVVTALLFGLLHAYQGAYGIFQTTGAGLALGALAVWRRSLWPSIVAHAAVDSFGLFALHVLLPRLQEALHQLGAHA